MTFEFTTVDVQALVAAAVQATSAACAARELKIEIDASEEIPPVHGDFERLLQVLVNLLDNTCRYAPPGSPVVVRIREHDAGVQIDVRDQGPGIAGTEQAHVFERFWRADRPHGDAGTGLGLAICRSIIHGHGGHIWLESEEGHGATFSIALPRSVFRTQPEDTEAGAYGPANPVLQGVNIARREQPDIVLLDLALPDLDGYDVLRVLKNDPATQGIPVVVLSVAPTLEQAHALGATEVLQKPARFEAVRWMLARALRRKHQPEGRLVVGMAPAVSKDLAVLAQVLEQETHGIYRGRDLQDLAAWSAAHYPDLLVLDEEVLPESRSEAAELLRHPVSGAPVPVVFLGHGAGRPDDGGSWVGIAKPVSKEEFLAVAQRVVTPAAQR
jgi:CheY-like chemotaxis protein/anti-sigma regulatory factor (Ser/Thr protein kinase)